MQQSHRYVLSLQASFREDMGPWTREGEMDFRGDHQAPTDTWCNSLGTPLHTQHNEESLEEGARVFSERDDRSTTVYPS